MRLRSIALANVRRFTGQRAVIRGIGDGISVVAQPNEFGKSTFFDALHALFFERYGSVAKAVKSLQPYAGGAVEIAAEIETAAGVFRVEKRFLSRKAARVLRPDGSAVAQDDEAERWIDATLGGGAGPAGLLWVRQGLTDLERKDDRQLETRRDLLSSVAGEIEAMTGGRRMDRVRARVAADLDEVATKTGRPKGPWKDAIDAAAQAETALAEATEKAAALSSALLDRAALEAALARLNDPAAVARRAAAQAAAQAALEDAEAHAQRQDQARQARDLAQLRAQGARAALDRYLAALQAQDRAARDRDAAQTRVAAASDAATAADAALATARTGHSGAEAARTAARAALDAARTRHAARKARDEAARLGATLQQAEAARDARDAAGARRAGSQATAAWLTKVEETAAGAARLEAARAAQAVRLHLSYCGAARVAHDGTPLPEGADIPLAGATELDLPGIGTLRITPGTPAADSTAADLDRARAALARLLAIAGASDLAAARAAARARAAAAQEADQAAAVLAALAPDGLDPLHAAHAAAVQAADADKTAERAALPALDTLAEALARAEATEEAARARRDAAQAEVARAREEAARASATAEAAAAALDRARAATAADATPEAHRAELARADARATEAFEAAAAALAAIEADAPDLETVRAEAARAGAAIDTATRESAALNLRRAARDAEIRTLAGAGIEAERDACAGRLAAARADEATQAARAAALTRLRDALDAARAAAREAYFGPVQQELQPLLAILHGAAQLQFDSDSLLPAGLTRGAVDEAFEALSGGTREQIAILTRLAFARLYARRGQHMPIVLDDALVHSDDDRIVQMFTALTRVARDQQILVFSCRQMAFQDLGGARPEVEVTPI